ncbi:MAG: CarD family transcriptional regulator [Alphaproteobacteria bacterium]|nr:CarD family transcriptional regulator [Alphaproteobacteria bacterium]
MAKTQKTSKTKAKTPDKRSKVAKPVAKKAAAASLRRPVAVRGPVKAANTNVAPAGKLATKTLGKAAPVKNPVRHPEPPKVAANQPEIRKVEPRTPEARRLELRKPVESVQFSTNDFVVYPTHGVGRITGIEEREIGGIKHKLFVISFEKDKMTLRVPVTQATQTGMRRLSTPKEMQTALLTLKGRSRVKRTMWSRRAQEYEAKINSGDPVAIAEVVRDLHRNVGQPEQSYSERQLYEAALARLARELAAVETIDEEAATEKLEQVLRAA